MLIFILLLRKQTEIVNCSAWFSLLTQHVHTISSLIQHQCYKIMCTGPVQLVNFSFRFFILEGNTPIKIFRLYFFTHTHFLYLTFSQSVVTLQINVLQCPQNSTYKYRHYIFSVSKSKRYQNNLFFA